ncbi:hypothetical protein GC167_08685 [bacterium]|nr:hypothetical protein [bacterium]
MSSPPDSANYFDSSHVLLYVRKWRKPLIVSTLAAGVLAAVFTAPFFLKPKFKSSVVVFPATTNSVSKALLPQQFSSKGQDVMEFGDEQEAEQLLQILNSDEIRSRIVEKYDLMRHYDINPKSKTKYTQLNKAYEGNVQFRRTEFMSVVIEVLDTDPDTAALIANDIGDLLNEVKNRIQKERALKGLQIVQAEYNTLAAEIQGMDDEITLLRIRGVHDYETQSSVYSEQLATAIVERGPTHASVRIIQEKLDTLAKYGSQYIKLRDESKLLKEELVKLKTRLDQAKVDVNETLPVTFTVNRAFPAERKSTPKRSLIVLVAMASAFVFSLVVIILTDSWRNTLALADRDA